MKIEKTFSITYSDDFNSVSFGTKIEEEDADPKQLFKTVYLATMKDIDKVCASNKEIRTVVGNAKKRIENSGTDYDALLKDA